MLCVWVCFAVAMWNDFANDLDKLDRMLEYLNNPDDSAPGQFIILIVTLGLSVLSNYNTQQHELESRPRSTAQVCTKHLTVESYMVLLVFHHPLSLSFQTQSLFSANCSLSFPSSYLSTLTKRRCAAE